MVEYKTMTDKERPPSRVWCVTVFLPATITDAPPPNTTCTRNTNKGGGGREREGGNHAISNILGKEKQTN